jgi:flagellar hook-length control protein FliK
MLAESNSSSLTTLVAGSVLTSSGQSSAPANPLSPTVLSLPIQPGMQNPAWTQVMSSRVVWMAKEGLQQAQLRMNPANLGPVEVKLHVQNDQASVTFLAQHSATRDALEQALPRLRESFAENGMELTNAQVGEQQQHHQEQSEQTSDSQFFTQAASQDDYIETEAVETVSSEQTAGLSLYA